ncbi:MAG: hypothetical protein RMY64_01875 [Nostoc sp. DedQUE08]|nr:hypothetical protein [Nostoc sp. DedQUE08]
MKKSANQCFHKERGILRKWGIGHGTWKQENKQGSRGQERQGGQGGIIETLFFVSFVSSPCPMPNAQFIMST